MTKIFAYIYFILCLVAATDNPAQPPDVTLAEKIMLPENQSVRPTDSGNLSRNLNTFHFIVAASTQFHTNSNLIFYKAQPKAIESIAELITQTHALNVFEIILIAAVTAYGETPIAFQRTIKLGNHQDILYLDVSIVMFNTSIN